MIKRAVCCVLLVSAAAYDASSGEASPSVSQLIGALSAPDALAEWRASRDLVQRGDQAVPALAKLAGAPGPLPPRLLSVELLGEIGTKGATDALITLLETERKALAVRGQVCMQLGYSRVQRAAPVIAEWLKTIGPRALHDVRGPKEVQPTTCYIRHLEALGMIGDARTIPAVEAFRTQIPKGVGYGGFLTRMATGATDHALEHLRAFAAFRKAVGRHPGLQKQIHPLFEHLRADPVARVRFYTGDVVSLSERGKEVLGVLARHSDAAVAAGAKALLARCADLRKGAGE